ncbi:glycine--tRNA ligase subunit beta [Oceanimonas baumannii]|uniref:Glycine--tRNA ligase beta subunit n=1 Tax=Oceanimonas baumannii TaxID=129578 RepID=A0A235CB56_9GAMM|nr:glycine--tRNA ligase subunit beta [Oceanimonas baumannii]OYD21025.1 glycine--tRNA ligase subunit beta [Oceanimonas baumannii]TDW53662.1 glycyl-tRNA synthetase beta chain [Oceanimonas baumannii]
MAEQNFLVEIGTEELPPKALRNLGQAFADNLQNELNSADLAFAAIRWFAAPRRLAVQVTSLAGAQPDKQVEKRGPAVQAAFDADGNPTKAALGWARGNGISVEQAGRLKTDKGEWLVHVADIKGQPAADLLPAMVEQALSKLPIPKAMRWGDKSIQFIRPVHTLTLLLGEELLPATILGISSDRIIRGHRFMGEQEFQLDHADHYLEQLERRGKVLADFERRKAIIEAGVKDAAAVVGGIADLEEELLEEVTSLVEWPVVLTASFEEEFLKVPAEALVYTMKGDQKYFPVYDTNGKLLPKLIFVTNIESKDPSQIVQGNEKVVRPRLADAEFFFNTDRKTTLASRLEMLDNVLFQQQLGTVKEKSERISALASYVAAAIGAEQAHAERAGLLSKCDLVTNMVFEFTDTQGVMGMHYARHDGEPEAVALALKEQYQPRFAGDDLPGQDVSAAVALADKLDTLVGIFGIGQAPKGDKDPFALRRAALGALRIIVEKGYQLDLLMLIDQARALYGSKLSNQNVADDVLEFMLGRFRSWYQDLGYGVDVIQAVLARRPTRPADFDARVKAVSAFRELDAAIALAAANKRVGNILSKFDGEIPAEVNAGLLQDDAEKVLAAQVAELTERLAPLFAGGDYSKALAELASLRESVDAFFDQVMVMADDDAVRLNRLALLNQLRNLFLRVADISLLQ